MALFRYPSRKQLVDVMASAGQHMRSEIFEQPRTLAGLLGDGLHEIQRVAALLSRRLFRGVLLVGRGTSDNAALYGKYLMETELGLMAGLASPSVVTVYGRPADLRGVLLICLSQSGVSPDLVEFTRQSSMRGAVTVCITNSPQSDLALASDHVIDIGAGVERSVTATKSYTGELFALRLLVASWLGRGVKAERRIPEAVERLLELESQSARLAAEICAVERVVALGRGFSYPTALELALKLTEAAYCRAQGFSAADVLHGPLASLDERTAVVVVAPNGPNVKALEPVVLRLRQTPARLFVVGGSEAERLGARSLRADHDLPEQLSPIADIVPLQLLSLIVGVAQGVDPDQPRHLSKVTRSH